MKGAFYPKLALDGIRKNKRLYIPYILTCVGMVTMFYIITFLQKSETVGSDAERKHGTEDIVVRHNRNRGFCVHIPFLHELVSDEAQKKGVRTI